MEEFQHPVPPGEENFIDGAEDLVAGILHEDPLPARNAGNELFLRFRHDAAVTVRRGEQHRAGDFSGAPGARMRRVTPMDSTVQPYVGTLLRNSSRAVLISSYQAKRAGSVAQEVLKFSGPDQGCMKNG